MRDPRYLPETLDSPASAPYDILQAMYDAELPKPVRGLYIGVGGTLVVEGWEGEIATFKNLPSGFQLACRPRRIIAAGTTARDIVGLR